MAFGLVLYMQMQWGISRSSLISLSIAADLWPMVLDLFGVCWVILKTVDQLLACWPGCFWHHRKGQLWIAALHCFM